jgi:hypothetical protein
MTNYQFIKDLPGGATFRLGTAVQSSRGWRFIPNVAGRKSSNKFHPTMRGCLPRWIKYPNGCRSVAVPHRTAETETP